MDSCLRVIKIATTDAMRDSGFVSDVTSTITNAGISVIKDDDIRESMVNVGKLAIVHALRDEGFLRVLRETLAESLKDGNIYRGAAAGVVGALNPWARLRRNDPPRPMRTESGDSIPEENGSAQSYRSESQ